MYQIAREKVRAREGIWAWEYFNGGKCKVEKKFSEREKEDE